MKIILLKGTLENLKQLKEEVKDRTVYASVGAELRRRQNGHEYVYYAGRVQTLSMIGEYMYGEPVYEISVIYGEVDLGIRGKKAGDNMRRRKEAEHVMAQKSVEVRRKLTHLLKNLGFTYRFGDIIERNGDY